MRYSVEQDAALHAAYFGQGSFIHIPKNVKLAKPLRLRGAHTGGHAGFCALVLVVTLAIKTRRKTQ